MARKKPSVLAQAGHPLDPLSEVEVARASEILQRVKKLGPEHTAVQWNSAATQRCAVFADLRACGGDSSRSKACPKLSDSIKHAVAEGCLEEVSSAPSPGDG